MQSSGTNIRSAEFMKLPGPGYGNIASVQVEQLLRIGEIVNDKNVGDAVQIQFMHEVAADKSRSAGDNVH